MKNFIASIMLLASSTVLAQSALNTFNYVQVPILCGPFSTLLATVEDKEIQEQPVWRGTNQLGGTTYVVFSNPKTGAFTLAVIYQTTACLLGVGEASETYRPSTSENTH